MPEMGAMALQAADSFGELWRAVREPDRDPEHQQRRQGDADRDVQVEEELLERRVLAGPRRHHVAAEPHEGEADRHQPVQDARGKDVSHGPVAKCFDN